MRYWTERAGIAHLTLRDARWTFLSGLLENGVDLSVAGDLADHASDQTAKPYDRRSLEAMRRAPGSWHMPVVQARQGGPRGIGSRSV